MKTKKPKTPKCPAALDLVAEAQIEIEAAADGADKPKSFSGTVYTGGAMTLEDFYRPVIVDLAGMHVGRQKQPVLQQHDPARIVGHTTAINVESSRLKIDGLISGSGEAATEVVATSRNGFPWQMSLGASVDRLVAVDEGETVQANGRNFKGPVLVARKTRLREVSFVPLGADANSSAKIAAQIAVKGATDMEFDQWLEAKGWNEETFQAFSESQQAVMKAAYDAEIKADDAKTGAAEKTKAAEVVHAAAVTDPPLGDVRKKRADEHRRIAMIEAAAADFPEICAAAIEGGWDQAQVEREVKREKELVELRASRPATGPAIHIAGDEKSTIVLECAARLGSSEPQDRVEKDYDERILEAAGKFRHLGIQEMVRACCALEGVPGPPLGAAPSSYMEAAFSTASLSGILGDSANKSMWAAYRAVPSVAKIIAKKLSANDFRTHTGYRLTGDPKMSEVAENGELKYGNLNEESYTYSVDTYGKMFGITRQMVINDDLGAFLEIPRLLGRGAALAIEDAFWTLVLANTGSFFAAGSNNYISGAGTALSSAALGTAVQTLMQQTDADGHPINLAGKYLVVPPELKVTADELFVSTNLQSGSTTKQPDRNVWAGKYEPLATPYLSNRSYTGYSATAWYLLTDPADQACFGIAYLNGQENPVVEEKEQPANLLGKLWRGYIDFGVCQIDARAGVKSKGSA